MSRDDSVQIGRLGQRLVHVGGRWMWKDDEVEEDGRPLIVYSCVDTRSLDPYEDFLLFYNREDAEMMADSFGEDSKYYEVHALEIA